jgi:hypothetical protein
MSSNEFRFTPDLLPWLHRHAPMHTIEALARGCGCASSSTIANICQRHGIAPSLSDVTGDDPPPFVSGIAIAMPRGAEPPKPERKMPHPALDPQLRTTRGNLLHPFEVKVDRSTTANLNIEATARKTTAAILGAVVLERVIARGMIADILEER